MGERASLSEFAADHPRPPSGFTAWLESIPEWPEVKAGWLAGVSANQILLWLRTECGYSPQEATRHRVAHLSKNYPRERRER